eukprot:4958573-Amphidinium_carterae.1
MDGLPSLEELRQSLHARIGGPGSQGLFSIFLPRGPRLVPVPVPVVQALVTAALTMGWDRTAGVLLLGCEALLRPTQRWKGVCEDTSPCRMSPG